MEKTDKSKIWFAVVNVYAASQTAAVLWKKAEYLLRQRGVPYHGTFTGNTGTAVELTFDACAAGYRRFIAVGGDGTVHDVLNGIANFVEWSAGSDNECDFSDFTLTVIPFGSGNDWIKSLGIPRDVDRVVDVITAGVTAKQDVVRVSMLDPKALPEESEISVSYMANIGGVGLDAKVCERVNAKKIEGRRGKILFITSLICAIRERKSIPMKVIADDKVIFDGPYYSMAFGIGKHSGGSMRQTPAAVLDDFLLDVTVIPEVPMRRLIPESRRLFSGTLLDVPEVVSAKCTKVVVLPSDMSTPQLVEVDGELVGNAPVKLEVLKTQLNVIVHPDWKH